MTRHQPDFNDVPLRTDQTVETTIDRANQGPISRLEPSSEFITHPGNELATAVVRLLAEGQTEGFSPLLIVGDPGSGKSRLLQLLVAETLRQKPEAVVTHVDAMTLRHWVSELNRHAPEDPESGSHNRRDPDQEFQQWSQLRESLRSVDLLVIDGLEDLAGREATQEELEQTIEELGYRDGAVVFTSKTIPKPGHGWSARFLSLIGAGLLVRISQPDESARRRFIFRWCASRGVTIPSKLVDQIAAEMADFGTLKGHLEKIRIKSIVERKPIESDLVERLKETDQAELPAAQRPDIRELTKVVGRAYHVTLADLRGHSRHPGNVRPRHIAIWLANRLTGLSNEKIAEFFGGRDPATIRHAIRQVEARRLIDFTLEEQLAALKLKIR